MRKDNVMLLYDYFCVKKFPFNQKCIICETNDRMQPPYPSPPCQLLATPLSFGEFCQINLKFTLIQSVPRVIIVVNTF